MDLISKRFRLSRWAALVILIPLVGPSCGQPVMNPSTDQARVALEAALDAWQEGKKPGNVEGTNPPVQAVDNDWTNGRKLIAYEIVAEKHSESDKRFAVKLRYKAPSPEIEAVYVVLGVSPIAVFREEDYERTLNMDNNPTPRRRRL